MVAVGVSAEHQQVSSETVSVTEVLYERFLLSSRRVRPGHPARTPPPHLLQCPRWRTSVGQPLEAPPPLAGRPAGPTRRAGLCRAGSPAAVGPDQAPRSAHQLLERRYLYLVGCTTIRSDSALPSNS